MGPVCFMPGARSFGIFGSSRNGVRQVDGTRAGVTSAWAQVEAVGIRRVRVPAYVPYCIVLYAVIKVNATWLVIVVKDT